MTSKAKHLFQICLYYIIIAAFGLLSFVFIPFESYLLRLLVADVIMTIVCFAFSIWKKNSSVYDAYWSVIPFYYGLFLLTVDWSESSIYHLLFFIVVSIWSWRLSFNWARSWHGFEHEDWRYVDLAAKHQSRYPLVNFFGIHLFPTMLVFGGMLPMFYAFNHDMNHLPLLMVGTGISLLGTALEYFADNQLARFKIRANPQVGDLLDTGIWGFSRNPNYLGEILFWLGVFIMGLSCGAPWYSGVGFAAMVFLFVFISIPMKEERMAIRRSNYEDYKRRVPMLIPRLTARI